MHDMQWSEAVDALATEYGALGAVITSLTTDELMAPSGCNGWTNADLVFHMLLDAQRALVTFNSPTQGPADKNFVSYWEGFQASDEGAQAHARFVRISASAHSDPNGIASRWNETARAASRNAKDTSGVELVTTQGHILTTADFIATLVVEATIHHLDLMVNLRDRPGPTESALAITTTTLDGLLKGPRPNHWNEVIYIRKATGRQPLTQEDRNSLGDAVNKLPLFS